LAYKQVVKGQSLVKLIPEIINNSLFELPIAKKMRWGNVATEFVRPVHWAVLLYGKTVINAHILGITAGNQSYGHRFHAPNAMTIKTPDDYLATLRVKGFVDADFERRKETIFQAANQAAKKVGGVAYIETALLEEVTALNEHPIAVIGHFDTRFLKLPKEVLITTMQSNQKYFPVIDETGDLLAHFITFSNINSHRPESVQKGNERVIFPRLADAEFFWNQDRKQPLAARVKTLNTIVFQQKLGTLADKTIRLQTLAAFIATTLKADLTLATRAALLAKTDLTTHMVSEFASLQGVVKSVLANNAARFANVTSAFNVVAIKAAKVCKRIVLSARVPSFC
jgi:glycyl-tRNA synthetase beta chain